MDAKVLILTVECPQCETIQNRIGAYGFTECSHCGLPLFARNLGAFWTEKEDTLWEIGGNRKCQMAKIHYAIYFCKESIEGIPLLKHNETDDATID